MSLKPSILSACKAHDSSDSGVISYSQLRSVLAKHGEELSDEEIAAMVEESEAGAGDQLVNYATFVDQLYAEDGDGDEDD